MFKDITGRKYGKLTAIKHVGFTPLNKYGKRYSIWLCKCDCGNDTGYVTEGEESKTVRCIECGHRLSRLKLTENRRISDEHE